MDQLPYSPAWLAKWRDDITESIGEVVLEDVGNGCFVHSARAVLHRLAEEGPVFIPLADDLPGFLDSLRRDVVRFVETGEPGYL
jgi:hypothetical protein